MRNDLEDILNIYSKLHPYSRLTLPTNGILTDRIVNVMKHFVQNNRTLDINLPLTVLGAGDKHDDITGVRGHFKKLNKTIEALQSLRSYPNFKIPGITVLSSFNQPYIEEVIKFFKEKKSCFDGFKG